MTCTLAIFNIKLSQERLADQCLTYPIPEFNDGDKVLVWNHTRGVWDPKQDVVYDVIHMMGCQLEFTDKGGKVCKVTVLDIRITYPVYELLRNLPGETTFWTCYKGIRHI